MTKLSIMPGESQEEFCNRIYKAKYIYDLTWKQVAEIINDELGLSYSEDTYRKRAAKQLMEHSIELDEEQEAIDFELDEVIQEKVRVRDERNQINSILRRISRENTLIEMVKESVNAIDKSFRLIPPKPEQLDKLKKEFESKDREAILQLSDLHYGIEIDNYWNKYNPDICKERLSQLRNKVIHYCDINKVYKLHVVNLGDLISGRIHTPLRINSRINVVTQTQEISELVAEFLADLTKYIPRIEYYDCLDNHSRVEPLKENSLELESLQRFTAWYLKERLRDFRTITINDSNKFAPDIINLNVLGNKVIAVHGDKDKPAHVIQNLSLMTQDHYELVLTSHRHHFSADEINQTLLLSNGSMMGTDDYAEKLRLSARPSQNLIIASRDNVMEVLYRIVLD